MSESIAASRFLPIDWLLEKENPSVRYFTLKDILGRKPRDPDVMEARREIMETGVVPKILSRQTEGGYWGKPEDFYVRSKYTGTVWQLLVLAELGADGKDNRVRDACEFILNNSQDPLEGGFAYLRAPNGGGSHRCNLPCLTGNMVWCLILLGYLEDPRVLQSVNWIAKYQRFDDGKNEGPKGWPYDGREKCYGRHTCHMGVVKALRALAEIPSGRRSRDVKDAIEKGVEYMLEHRIYKRSRDLSKVAKPSWLQFGFPNMWNTDALEVLDILTKLGIKDERMEDAVNLVSSKQDDRGRWKLENTFNGRFQANIDKKGKPSKWITLRAIRALKRYYE